jgi:hypothetical protein
VAIELTCSRRSKSIFCGGGQVFLARKSTAGTARFPSIAGWARHLLDQVLVHNIGTAQSGSSLTQLIEQILSPRIHCGETAEINGEGSAIGCAQLTADPSQLVHPGTNQTAFQNQRESICPSLDADA